MTEEQLTDLRSYFPLHKLTLGTFVPETMEEYLYGEGFAITTEANSNHGPLVQLGELCNEGYATVEQTADGWVWLGECYEGTATPARHPYNPDANSIEARLKGPDAAGRKPARITPERNKHFIRK